MSAATAFTSGWAMRALSEGATQNFMLNFEEAAGIIRSFIKDLGFGRPTSVVNGESINA
jgi:hypothetical protein